MAEEKNTPEGAPTPVPAQTPERALRKESIWEVYYPRSVDGETDGIPLASFPMIIYFWPSLLAMFFCGVTQGITEDGPERDRVGGRRLPVLQPDGDRDRSRSEEVSDH